MISQKQRAYAFIRNQLSGGVLPVGARVSDFTLCKELGISRAPVREAISQLASEGVLEQIPHFGTFVKRLSRAELEELFDLREILESHAGSRAARRIGEAEIAELKKLCDRMLSVVKEIRSTQSADLEGELLSRQVRDDVTFHLRILESADRPKLLQVVSDLRILTNLFSQNRREPGRDAVRLLARTYREHCLIVRALEQGKPELAAKRIQDHIRKAKETALAYYDATTAVTEQDGSDLVRSNEIREMVRKMEMYQEK